MERGNSRGQGNERPSLSLSGFPVVYLSFTRRRGWNSRFYLYKFLWEGNQHGPAQFHQILKEGLYLELRNLRKSLQGRQCRLPLLHTCLGSPLLGGPYVISA